MKTNSIQNNNTNFGMALKINPKLKPQLLSAHSATIERLQKIGKEAKNVKLYDVCYEKDIYIPSVRSVVNQDGKDYFAEMQRQEQLLGKPYTLTYGDETHQGYNPKEPPIFKTLYKEEAAEKYRQYASLPNHHEKAVALSKILEERDMKYMKQKEIAKQAELVKKTRLKEEKEKHEIEVDNLLSQYQYNFEQKTEKNSLWKKLTNKFISLFLK